MENLTEEQLTERIRIAREFKRSAFGSQYVTEEVYGDKPTKETARDRRATCNLAPEVIRSRQTRYNRIHQLHRVTTTKAKNGGISGVTKIPHTRKGVAKFRAWIGWGSRVYSCALDAAECRNREMERSHPGEDAYQCDMDAVWRKWGCTCGNHKRDE